MNVFRRLQRVSHMRYDFRMKRKVLFISSMAEDSKTGGAMVARRNYDCIKHLFGDENVEYFGLTHFDISGRNGIVTFVGRLFNLFVHRMNGATRRLEKQITDKVVGEDIAFVFIDSSLNGTLIRALKKSTGSKIVAFFHNCELSLLWQNMICGSISALVRLLPAYINERLTMRYADVKIALNGRDKNLLEKVYGRDISGTVPVTFDDRATNSPSHDASSPLKLLFVGSNFFPNIRGVKWFIKNVLPFCNAILTFVGRDVDKAGIKDSPNLVIVPNPDDMEPYYNDADLVVVPIFYGGGMKVKVAEALMYGKHVLATEEAMHGYEDIPTVKRCDTASEFIYNINNFTGETYSRESRAIYENRYSTQSAIGVFKNILRSI